MRLIRLFLYDQAPSASRFAVEILILAGLIGAVVGLAVASTLVPLLHSSYDSRDQRCGSREYRCELHPADLVGD